VAFELPSTSVFEFVLSVAQAYVGLVEDPLANPETGLGGKLFYAGELDEAGRALVSAANIAGAATLVATADSAAQKQALRDGVIDFAVTSLDEALRILKNELRKRQTVSVSVAIPPETIETEMKERGVVPDLLRGDLLVAGSKKLLLPKSEAAESDFRNVPAIVTWSVDSALPGDLAKIDEIALDCLAVDDWTARRWVRLAPRFLGRLSRELHLLKSHMEFATRFAEQTVARVERGEISFAYEIRTYVRDPEKKNWMSPGTS